jgi:hypothetical protein
VEGKIGHCLYPHWPRSVDAMIPVDLEIEVY